jgi:uncharacterized membrane protein YagU involved in acid resistance
MRVWLSYMYSNLERREACLELYLEPKPLYLNIAVNSNPNFVLPLLNSSSSYPLLTYWYQIATGFGGIFGRFVFQFAHLVGLACRVEFGERDSSWSIHSLNYDRSSLASVGLDPHQIDHDHFTRFKKKFRAMDLVLKQIFNFVFAWVFFTWVFTTTLSSLGFSSSPIYSG